MRSKNLFQTLIIFSLLIGFSFSQTENTESVNPAGEAENTAKEGNAPVLEKEVVENKEESKPTVDTSNNEVVIEETKSEQPATVASDSQSVNKNLADTNANTQNETLVPAMDTSNTVQTDTVKTETAPIVAIDSTTASVDSTQKIESDSTEAVSADSVNTPDSTQMVVDSVKNEPVAEPVQVYEPEDFEEDGYENPDEKAMEGMEEEMVEMEEEGFSEEPIVIDLPKSPLPTIIAGVQIGAIPRLGHGFPFGIHVETPTRFHSPLFAGLQLSYQHYKKEIFFTFLDRDMDREILDNFYLSIYATYYLQDVLKSLYLDKRIKPFAKMNFGWNFSNLQYRMKVASATIPMESPQDGAIFGGTVGVRYDILDFLSVKAEAGYGLDVFTLSLDYIY